VVEFIGTLLRRWPGAADCFPFEFLLSLLAVPSLPVLNRAVDLFAELTVEPVAPSIAGALLEALFGAMPRAFFARQIRIAVDIVANLIGTASTAPAEVQAAFGRYFTGEDAEFLTELCVDFANEAAERLWGIVARVRRISE
jgi:hypothetical protein